MKTGCPMQRPSHHINFKLYATNLEQFKGYFNTKLDDRLCGVPRVQVKERAKIQEQADGDLMADRLLRLTLTLQPLNSEAIFRRFSLLRLEYASFFSVYRVAVKTISAETTRRILMNIAGSISLFIANKSMSTNYKNELENSLALTLRGQTVFLLDILSRSFVTLHFKQLANMQTACYY